MQEFDRRQALRFSGAALSMATLSAALKPMQSLAAGQPKAPADATNPLGARVSGYTIVSPDIEAAIGFYRDVMEHEVVARGTVPAHAPTIDGVGLGNRPYALLRHGDKTAGDTTVIRLLQAPKGAAANRPRPDSSIVDPGLALIECHPADANEAYRRFGDHGVATISPPQYYYFGDSQLPGDSGNAFSAFGPSGEQILLNCQNLPDTFNQRRPVGYKGIIGPLSHHVLVIWDRWPVLAFYRNAFGLEQAASADARAPFDRLLAQESVDTLIGAPAGTYYRSIGLGGNELWEYRQRRPAPTPPWPTSIDRTGLAMLTMQVENLADARARIAKTGIGIVGEGALPSLNGKNAAGFHVRGPAGELIEIAARG